jgi:tetratricopeptide (TPR) repeat protein
MPKTIRLLNKSTMKSLNMQFLVRSLSLTAIFPIILLSFLSVSDSRQFQTSIALGQTVKVDSPKTEAERLFQQGKQQYDKSRRNEAINLTRLGKSYLKTRYSEFFQSREDSRKALQYSTQGLQIAQKLRNRSLEAEALFIVGQAQRALENYPEAIAAQKQRLMIAREFKNTWMESVTLTEVGISYNDLQKQQQAIEAHQKSVSLHRQRHEQYLLPRAANSEQ